MFEQYRNHAGQYAANYYRSMLAHQKSLDQYGNYFVASKIGEAAFWTAAMSVVGMGLAPVFTNAWILFRAGKVSGDTLKVLQASQIYQTAGRLSAGLTVALLDDIKKKSLDGRWSSKDEWRNKLLLVFAISMVAIPGDKISTRLSQVGGDKSILKKLPHLPGIGQGANSSMISHQTTALATLLVSKSAKPLSETNLVNECLTRFNLEKHDFNKYFDEFVNQFSAQFFEASVRASKVIEDEISKKDFTGNVPRSFKAFDFKGNTENYNKDMRGYVAARSLALFWQKVEDRLIILSHGAMAAKLKYANTDRTRK